MAIDWIRSTFFYYRLIGNPEKYSDQLPTSWDAYEPNFYSAFVLNGLSQLNLVVYEGDLIEPSYNGIILLDNNI